MSVTVRCTFTVLLLICFLNSYINCDQGEKLLPIPDDRESVRINELKEITEKIVNRLQKDVDPCNDWKKFACFTEDEHGPIKFMDYEYLQSLDENDKSISKSEIKMKHFIESSKNKNYIEQLKNLNIAKMIGGWPIFTDNWSGDKMDLSKIFGLLNNYGIYSIFRIDRISDQNDVGLNEDYVFTLDEIYKEQKKKDENNVSLYIKPDSDFIDDEIYKERFETFNITTDKFENLETKVIPELIKFNKEIKNFFSIDGESYKLYELNEEIPEFNWNTFFMEYFQSSNEFINEIQNSSFTITVHSTEKLKNFVKFLQNYDKEVIANYVMWKMVYNDEFWWLSEGFSVEERLRTFEPIAAKLSVRKGYTKFLENLYIDSRKESINILKELLKQEQNEQNEQSNTTIIPVIQNGIRTLEKQISFLRNNRHSIIKNDFIDSYFEDFEVNKSNYLQNFYNYKSKDHKLVLHRQQRDLINHLFEFFHRITYFDGKPTFHVFKSLRFLFWSDFIRECNKNGIISNPKFQNAVECLKDVVADKRLRQEQILHNELLRLSYKTYYNWAQKNSDIVNKENEIIQKIDKNFNVMKLFTLYGGCDLGVTDKTILPGVVSHLYNCPETSYSKCTVFDV